MDTNTFLRLVLPDDSLGFKALRIPSTRTVNGKQITFEMQAAASTTEDAGRIATKASDEGKDVFICMASQREAPVKQARLDKAGMPMRHPDGRPQMRTIFRRQANAHYLKALFLDLDVDAGNSKKFQTTNDALAALKTFCTDIGFKRPLIIQSGPKGGVHCYWPFTEAVPAAEWLPVATMLKLLCLRLGFNIDATVPADTARVLRVVGTKRGDFIVGPIDTFVPQPHDFARYAAILTSAATRYGVTVDEACTAPLGLSGGPTNTDGLGDNTDRRHDRLPVSLAEVVKHCQTLRQSYDTGGATDSEPVWYGNVGFAAYCDDPEEAAFKLSGRHPEFEEETTRQKMLQWRDKMSGPPLCTGLERTTNKVSSCDGCVHQGVIKSPIVLGRYVREAPPPVIVDMGDDGTLIEVTIPNPPHPFKRSEKGTIYYETGGEDGVNKSVEICAFDMHPARLMDYEKNGERTMVWRATLPHQGPIDLSLPQRMLSVEPGRLMGELGAKGVTIAPKHAKAMAEFMSAYVKQLQYEAPASKQYATMGWRGNNFVTPTGVISPQGYQAFPYTPAFRTEGVGDTAGTLAGQVGVLKFYSQPQYRHFQLPMLMVMASPLLYHTTTSGMVVALWGRSGCGKTTAMEMVNSLWGHPELLSLNLTKGNGATNNALFHHMYLRQNIHCVLDEASQVDVDRMGTLMYSCSQGVGKGRMTSGLKLADPERFKGTYGMTANNDPVAKIGAGVHSNAEAQMMRIISFNIPVAPRSAKQQADMMIRGMRSNYGHLGPAVMEYVVRHQDKIVTSLINIIEKLDREINAATSERFWSSGFGCGIVWGLVMKRLKFIDWDMDAIYRDAIEQVALMRGNVIDNVADNVSLAKEMIMRLQPNTLYVADPIGNMNIEPLMRPKSTLLVRYENDKARMYVARSAVKEYCTENVIDMRALAEDLGARKILLSGTAKKRLGAHTDYDTVQVACWVFDLAHPEMCGTAAKVLQGGIP